MALSSFLFHRQKLRYCGNSGHLVSGILFRIVASLHLRFRHAVDGASVSIACRRAVGRQLDREPCECACERPSEGPCSWVL